jgi:hypothetical protein
MRPYKHAVALAAVVGAALALSAGVAGQTSGAPERYSASAINTNNGTVNDIDITIDRWSTEAERSRLITTLREKGPDKLLDVLKDMRPTGHFGAPGNLSWDLRFARKVPMPDGGERVVVATDRRIGFWEQSHQTRTLDYPFTIIELRLNAEGEGEGKMSLATKVILDEERNTVTLENWQLQPVLLTNVKREAVRTSN